MYIFYTKRSIGTVKQFSIHIHSSICNVCPLFRVSSDSLDCVMNNLFNGTWLSFFRRHIEMHFREWKCMNFHYDFTEVCSWGSKKENIPALVQMMAWRLPGDKSLSEPVMVNVPTHICVTRPQWVEEQKKTDTDLFFQHDTVYGNIFFIKKISNMEKPVLGIADCGHSKQISWCSIRFIPWFVCSRFLGLCISGLNDF